MRPAADLLRSLTALGVTFTVDGDSFRASAPSGVLTPQLRARIGEHRDALRELLASPDRLAQCTPWDELLIDVNARRFSRDALTGLIGKWLAQYAASGYVPFLETAAWFAAAREAQDRFSNKEASHAA